MSYYKMTYSSKYKRATLYNDRCNFHCIGCAYKLKGWPKAERALSLDEIKQTLQELDVERVHLMGGEPTYNTMLPDVLALCKQDLGLKTFLGHTNGSKIPLVNLDGANVSLKAYSPQKHLEYTGQPADMVYDNFRMAFDAGLEMKASCVYIPGFIDVDEVEKMVRFIASLSREIPFHIMGYIPVPGTPWRRPTEQEMANIVALAKTYLDNIGFSHLTRQQALDLSARDDRFRVARVL